jgi:serine protease Do
MPIPIPGRIAEALRRSTAQVRIETRQEQGNGSAVVLPGDRAITNAHVVRGDRLIVESWEGTRISATLMKIDQRRDLALLRVPGLRALAASLGDSDELKVGTPVIAVGNPLGFTGAVSSGIVHRVGPAAPISQLPWIHADVRLAPGNSGGPLADFQGQIVGINTMIVGGGLALAVPSRTIQAFLARETPGRTLGVVVRPVQLRNQKLGMMILELVPGGGAEMASLLLGDILVGANDSAFRYIDDLQAAIDSSRGTLRLDFYRAGQRTLRHVTATLASERMVHTNEAA